MTYSLAVKTLQKQKAAAGILTWDSGEGWTSKAFYCPQRRRIIFVSVNPAGQEIVS